MTNSKKQIATPEIMEEELCEYVSSNSDEWCLGLVTINHIAELYGVTKTYSFLHLTVQEFLTAYYITNLEEDKQLEILNHMQWISSPTIIFYFGLTPFTSSSALMLSVLLLKFENNRRLLYNCALESQQQVACDKVGEYCEGRYFIYSSAPSDLYAMGYVILNTSHPVTKISLGTYPDHIDVANFLECIRSKDFSALQTLEIEDIRNISAPALYDTLKSCSSLIQLNLTLGEISHDNVKAITDRIKCLTSLKNVSIKCSSTFGSITTLLSGFTHLKNTKLQLSFYNMDPRDMFEIGRGLQLLINDSLSSFTLERCVIDDDAATALANGLHSNVNIHSLDISDNSISPGGVITLLNETHCLTKLTELYLSGSNIGCDGATALANQLKYLTQLRELDLSHNNIGPSGAVSLAKTLYHLTELHVLDLSHNNIDLHSAIAVITASKDCPCLSDIKFTNTDIKDYFSNDIHVGGLVSPEDNTAITDLMTATQHPIIQRYLLLGFKSVILEPLT